MFCNLAHRRALDVYGNRSGVLQIHAACLDTRGDMTFWWLACRGQTPIPDLRSMGVLGTVDKMRVWNVRELFRDE